MILSQGPKQEQNSHRNKEKHNLEKSKTHTYQALSPREPLLGLSIKRAKTVTQKNGQHFPSKSYNKGPYFRLPNDSTESNLGSIYSYLPENP